MAASINCINIGAHVTLLSGPTVYSLYTVAQQKYTYLTMMLISESIHSGSLAFYRRNHTYNTQMPFQLRTNSCKIKAMKFRQLSVCASKIVIDTIQVYCCVNMAQIKCFVSFTVDFLQ